MNEVLNRPELALAAALLLTLVWVGLAFWLRLRPMGDDVGARLDALQPSYEMADLRPEARPAEKPRPTPAGMLPRVVMPNIFEQLCQELGVSP
jgi:hypothetical protein